MEKNSIAREAWRLSAGGLIAVFIFGAFINLLKFAMPLYTLQILDRIPDSRSVETLLMLTLIALLAVISGVALEGIRTRMFVRWAAWIKRRFGTFLVQSGMSGSHKRQSQTASKSLNDLKTLRRFIERAMAPLMDVVWAPVFIIVVYFVHPVFAAIMLFAMGLRLLLGLMERRLTLLPKTTLSSTSNDARSIVNSAERNAETIGVLNMATNLTERWHDNIVTNLEERDRSQSRTALFASLNKGLYRCLYVGGMGTGVWLVVQNSLTIGGVIAGNIIMRFGFRLVDRATKRWDMFTKARRAYRRLTQQLEVASSKTITSMTPDDMKSPLILERVSFRYPNQADSVFRRINLTVPKGESLCIIGPSASGKTTFSRLITGIITPRAGQVRLGNVEIARLPTEKKSQLIGYLPQEARLFKGSVRDNIARMSEGDFDAIMDAAQLAGIHDTIIRLAQGYDTLIDEDSQILSGGERKRIALARSYYGRPRLIVLDEPEANLDRASRNDLYKALHELTSTGSNVVVTTQSNRIGKITDKTLILGGDRPRIRKSNEDDTELLNEVLSHSVQPLQARS